jgi:pyruvate formate lyase activating enzyme
MQTSNGKSGRIHSIESFGTVDGPGIRFVIFMQGCALRCQYCHNPDTWNMSGGTEYTPQQLMTEIQKYKSYLRFSAGGITFTGGEPLLQAEFVSEVAKLCKKQDLNVAIDTSGYVWNDSVKEVLDYTDIVLLDIKNFNPKVYETVTGASLAPTLSLLDYLKEKNINTWIRYVLVPGLTDNLDSIRQLSEHLTHYPNVSKVELLGFHKMGEYKWKEMNLDYKLGNTAEPSQELLMEVKAIFESSGKEVSI